MDASEYQAQAMRTRGGVDDRDGLILSALGLCGEAGEYAEHVKKHVYHGHALDRELAAKELGDVAWYLALGCSALGVDLSEVLRRNVEKLWARYPAGFDPAASRSRRDGPDTA